MTVTEPEGEIVVTGVSGDFAMQMSMGKRGGRGAERLEEGGKGESVRVGGGHGCCCVGGWGGGDEIGSVGIRSGGRWLE